MEALGKSLIYVSWGLSIYTFLMLVLGILKNKMTWIQSAYRGIAFVYGLIIIFSIQLLYLLGTSDFRFEYVVNYTSKELALAYKLSAFWAGNAGSLTLWLVILATYGCMVLYSKKIRGNAMMPYVMAIVVANMIFFLTLLTFVEQPFQTLETVPTEGRGLNPQLQNPAMLIHPVMLYHGYVGMVIPFAFGIAALLLKQVDAFWIKITRRWTLIAWLFLTAGNILGGAWAYVELGWGGYWAWDPVENASFMPWLTATAFLHSAMVQERRNMLKIWNISLIILTYSLTLFGTFLVRSGVITSVHAFGDSNLGLYFLIFMGIMVIASLYILFTRYGLLSKGTEELRSFISKESSFLLNNLLLVGATFAVFWGTIFPLVSEAIKGTRVTVGAPYFNSVVGPILLAMLLLMGISPLIAWQKSSLLHLRQNFTIPVVVSAVAALLFYLLGMKNNWALLVSTVVVMVVMTHFIDFAKGIKARMKVTKEPLHVATVQLVRKNRRRYGGYLVHIGIAMMAVGIIGSQVFQQEKLITLSQGETMSIGPYQITYESIGEKKVTKNDVVYANLVIEESGKLIDNVQPEKVFYTTFEQPSSEVALLSSFEDDLYIVLSSWETDGKATFLVKLIPLVIWIWIGSVIVGLGGLLAISDSRFSAKKQHRVKEVSL